MYKATITPWEITLYSNDLCSLKEKAFEEVGNMRNCFVTVVYEDEEGYLDSDEFFIDTKGNIEYD